MKLKVQNVARVSNAELDLSGITVIAGGNGTGKSTISRALMTLCSVSRRIVSLIQHERLTSMVIGFREALSQFGANTYLFGDRIDAKSPNWAQWFSRDWWTNTDNVISWLRAGNAKRTDGSLLVFPPDFIDKSECRTAIETAREKVLGALDRDDINYAEYITKKAFKEAFRRQMNPVFNGSSESSIEVVDKDLVCSVSFKDSEISNFSGMGVTFFPTVMYFEPLNYVDFINEAGWMVSDRYTAGGLCVCNAITRRPSKNLSLEQDKDLQEAVQSVREIVGTIHGRLVDDADQEIKFAEKFSDGEFLIDVKNIASGMKTMAAIVRAVENRSIQRGSMLIIDEPESNLHPEWQVRFAHFLVLLSKRLNITLLLNTHSPYFLQAIRKYSKIDEVKSHCYNMTFDGNGDSFHTESVSDRIDVVFKTMSKPFNDLMAM